MAAQMKHIARNVFKQKMKNSELGIALPDEDGFPGDAEGGESQESAGDSAQPSPSPTQMQSPDAAPVNPLLRAAQDKSARPMRSSSAALSTSSLGGAAAKPAAANPLSMSLQGLPGRPAAGAGGGTGMGFGAASRGQGMLRKGATQMQLGLGVGPARASEPVASSPAVPGRSSATPSAALSRGHSLRSSVGAGLSSDALLASSGPSGRSLEVPASGGNLLSVGPSNARATAGPVERAGSGGVAGGAATPSSLPGAPGRGAAGR